LSRYRHVIWDWNGTLLDDVAQAVGVLNTMLARRHMPLLSLERYRELLRFPVIEFYRDLGFDLETERYEAVADEYIAGYAQRWRQCPLQPGAREKLAELAQAGLTQSVLSAYQQTRLEEAVAHFDLGRWFVRLVGLNDHYAAGKQAHGRRWMRELGLAGHEVLLIGDTVHDWEVAQAIGAACALLAGGHQDRRTLESCGAPVLDSLTDLTMANGR